MISIIVPVYNSEKYLRRCVDSILNQTFEDIEIILIDDGSTDSSGKICDEYAAKNAKVIVRHQENAGQAAARNFGFQIANAEWICFVDSDDMIQPRMLEILYDAAIKEKCKIAMCGACEATEVPKSFFNCIVENETEVITMDEDGLLYLRENGEHRFWVVWAKLIHRDIIAAKPFTDGRIYEDNAIVPQWLDLSKKVVNIKDRLYFYQINSEGTTKKGFSLKQLDYLWALETQLSFYISKKMICLYEKTAGQYAVAISKYALKCVGTDNYGNLKKRYISFRWKNKQIRWNRKEREWVMQAFYPRTFKLRELVTASIHTLQAQGLTSLIKKVFRYLKRSGK